MPSVAFTWTINSKNRNIFTPWLPTLPFFSKNDSAHTTLTNLYILNVSKYCNDFKLNSLGKNITFSLCVFIKRVLLFILPIYTQRHRSYTRVKLKFVWLKYFIRFSYSPWELNISTHCNIIGSYIARIRYYALIWYNRLNLTIYKSLVQKSSVTFY